MAEAAVVGVYGGGCYFHGTVNGISGMLAPGDTVAMVEAAVGVLVALGNTIVEGKWLACCGH